MLPTVGELWLASYYLDRMAQWIAGDVYRRPGSRIRPSNGVSMSRTSLMAAAIANAQRNTARITVTFLGANRPKLTNRTVNQRTTAPRNGRGTELMFSGTFGTGFRLP